MFHTILGGMNREHNALGSYIFCGLRELLLEQLQSHFPCLRDIHVDLTPSRMGGRCQINVAIAKQSDDEPNALMDAIYSSNFDTFPLSLIVQRIVVVDEDVNIRDSQDIEWAIAMRAHTEKRFRVYEATGRRGGSTTRLAIDTTLDRSAKESGERPKIPNTEHYPLDKYL
jgi:2,5-furandicarboxylate decarboxylase 1